MECGNTWRGLPGTDPPSRFFLPVNAHRGLLTSTSSATTFWYCCYCYYCYFYSSLGALISHGQLDLRTPFLPPKAVLIRRTSGGWAPPYLELPVVLRTGFGIIQFLEPCLLVILIPGFLETVLALFYIVLRTCSWVSRTCFWGLGS